LGLAWAQPLGTEKVPRERATVVMVVDTSLSMQAEDVEPDRLTAAKDSALAFVNELPVGYNVALVSLHGTPQIKMPPSTDRGAVGRALRSVQLGEGRALGEAITGSLEAIAQAPVGADEEAAPAMIVMLSDGTNTVGAGPDGPAAAAKTAEVPVFTIAYGTQ